MTEEEKKARRASRIVAQIRPKFSGEDRCVQGAVLANLLAFWLANHIVYGDQAATDAMREDLLQTHIKHVRNLIPVNHKTIHESDNARRH